MSPPALSDNAVERGDATARRGSWAESSATYFSRQPLSPKDVDRVRTEFRQLCLRHYGSLVGAWKAMDVNSDGRLSYFEFLRACKHMQMRNARAVWSALGRSGFVSLQELDPLLAQQLGSLAAKLWTLFGSLEEAWRNCFNPTARLRISRDDFVQACEGLRFRHGEACFAELCSEKACSGMSRKEFGFLHTWLGRGPDRGFIDPPPSRWEKERRPWTPPVPRLKKFERRQKFKDCLLRSYGNFVRAWREGLDRDHNHKLDYHEFSTAVKALPLQKAGLWDSATEITHTPQTPNTP
ncbi:USP20 [Symbiodinium sp. CCMP2592]|nr:USP20 [Symbiodinium sp. CCMP2592]